MWEREREGERERERDRRGERKNYIIWLGCISKEKLGC